MAKQCEGCGFYSASNDPTSCPECAGTLKFTFLPPAGKNAAPIAGLPTDPVNELSRRHRADGGSRIHWGLVKAICVALVTVTIMGVRFYLRQEARDQREAQTAAVDKIRPGMHISQAARLLEAGSNMPKWRGSIRHDFDPDDDSDGSMDVNDGRNDLKITWRNGYVTSVERAGGSGGTRRRSTVVTADPDEDDDGGITDPQTGEVTHPSERVIARPDGGR